MITQNNKATIKVEHTNIDGIHVIYIKNKYSNEMRISKRMISFASFMLKSTLIAVRHKDVDMVISTSTPLSVGLPALAIKGIRNKPFLFEVRDLWPEAPIQMGALKNPIMRWLASSFEKTLYRKAKHIIALSPGMYDGIIKHVPKNKVSMIPNMAKNDRFWPRPPNEKLTLKLGLSRQSFKIIHFGSMGTANGLQYMMEAAKIISEKIEKFKIEFIFLGYGRTKERCISYAKEHQLTDVHFLERVDMDTTSEIVNLCDISVISFLNLPILATNSPNKFFDSLSAAKPIIVNSDGWTRRIVEDYSCGVYVDPERPEDLANTIIELKKNHRLLEKMGRNGRRLAETRYDKTILTKQFTKTLEKHFQSSPT